MKKSLNYDREDVLGYLRGCFSARESSAVWLVSLFYLTATKADGRGAYTPTYSVLLSSSICGCSRMMLQVLTAENKSNIHPIVTIVGMRSIIASRNL